MEYGIIVDSCCDMTPQLKERLGAVSVPLTMRLGEEEFSDDADLDLKGFMRDMKACKERVGSASPAPQLYQRAMEDRVRSFVVTISSKLSGSYSSALVGRALAQEEGEIETHIFDSKSASAGQTLIALKLHRLLSQGVSKEQVVQSVSRFIDGMKTYFVLERYDNLQKNGRLGRLTGTIAGLLGIKLLMGSDGDGNIALFAKPRGTQQMLEKLLAFIASSGRETRGEELVISHCNNPGLAERLAEAVKQRFDFGEIHVIPTGGLSSLYADDKGIVMAF